MLDNLLLVITLDQLIRLVLLLIWLTIRLVNPCKPLTSLATGGPLLLHLLKYDAFASNVVSQGTANENSASLFLGGQFNHLLVSGTIVVAGNGILHIRNDMLIGCGLRQPVAHDHHQSSLIRFRVGCNVTLAAALI